MNPMGSHRREMPFFKGSWGVGEGGVGMAVTS